MIMVGCGFVGYMIKARRRGEEERARRGGNYTWKDEAVKQREDMEEGWKRMMGVSPPPRDR